MRVLIITNHIGEKSGWGRYSQELIDHLLLNNFKVSVVCHKKNYNYKNVEQFEILPPPLSFKRSFIFSFFYLLKLKKIDSLDYDFLHCFVEPYSSLTYFLSKYLKLKYFLTVHGSYGVKPFSNKLYGCLQSLAYKNANKVVCVSRYTKNRIMEYEKLDNLIVIPNGININKFSSVSNSKKRKENIVIGVGALKKRKGFDLVLKAVSIVRKQIPDIKYYIVGDSRDKSYFMYLKKIIADLDLTENIFFYEDITDKKLKELYDKSKIFVLTPVSDKYNFEGFGLTYLEANAVGLPVIGSCGNGGEDAINDGYNWFLAKANDPEDTAEKIIKLLNNQELYEKMSKDAIDWSREMSWSNIIKKYLEIYEYKK